MDNIVLCGFMGCGKSSAGRIVASKLNRPFVDVDEYIERREGKTVSQIFSVNGERAFRDIEHDVCAELAQKNGLVIAAGGGAITFERNITVFKFDKIVFLDAAFEEIERRIGGCVDRPLFKSTAKARTLYEQRRPIYRAAADITVDADGGAEATAELIIEAIRSEE